MNIVDILQIKFPNADFLNDIHLAQIDDNINIIYWNTDKLGTQPTQQDIDAWNLDTSINLQYLQKQVEYQLRILIEAKPREKGYDNIATISSYITSSNVQWKAEAEAFIVWRDSVFDYAYSTLDSIKAGTQQSPTIEAFMAGLPALAWPV